MKKLTIIKRIVKLLKKLKVKQLLNVEKELRQLGKLKTKTRKKKRKGSMKKGSPKALAWGRKMKRLRGR